jgi:hypothetical protein
VAPLLIAFTREKTGYYWYAREDVLGVPWRNTSAERTTPYATVDDAKMACKAYVRDCFAAVLAGRPISQKTS